jgi:chromosome segregation ATPase
LNELHLREQEIDAEVREAEEQAIDSSEALRELQDSRRRQQEELKNLARELKELADQLQDPSLSSAEQDEIRQKILGVLEKIDAIRPPQIRPANRQHQGQPHQQPQPWGQQVGGSHAPSAGRTGAGVGREGGSPDGRKANSGRLVKGPNQRIGAELEKIQKSLNADKESIEKAYKTYLTSFSSFCRDPNAFEGLRQQALGALESLSERNKNRLGRLNELQSSMFKPGQPLDQKFLVSITTCKQNCAQFADRLESIKEEVKNLTPAKVMAKELSQRPNILQRHFGQAIHVH